MMKTKSKTILIILATLVIGAAIGALLTGLVRQNREHRFTRMMPEQQFRRVMEHIIQPNDEQRKAIDRILTKRFAQITEIQEQYQNEIFVLYDSLRKDLSSVLTADQRFRLEKRLAEGHHRLTRLSIERLTQALKLDETQRKSVEAIMNDFEKQFKADRKKTKGKWEEHRRAVKNRREKLHAAIETILTPEQKQKFEALKEQIRPPFAGPWQPPFRGKRHEPVDPN